MPKPYSVKSLSTRWSCSPGYVYRHIKSGELRHFRVGGQLLRIAAEEVERWEEQSGNQATGPTKPQATALDGSVANTPPSGTKTESVAGTSLALQQKQKRELRFIRSRERT